MREYAYGYDNHAPADVRGGRFEDSGFCRGTPGKGVGMSEIDQLLAQLLAGQIRQAKTRSAVNGRFTALLDSQINIGPGVRSRASRSQTNLRDLLRDENGRDSGFPRILQTEESDFLGGSFDRHVKVWPLDDIDVFFPIDGSGLYYSENGSRSRFHVRTDDSTLPNPLYSDTVSRWTKPDGTISSAKLLSGFKAVLKRRYPNTKVAIDGQAINTQFSIDSSNESDGLGFDIVPCFSLFDSYRMEPDIYVIPDGNDGWISTNPRLDKVVSTNLQANNDKCHRPSVKLVKYWNKTQLSSKISSYYIELAISRDLESRNARGETVTRISEAVAYGFQAVSSALQSGDLQPRLRQAPLVEDGYVTHDDKRKVETASALSGLALSFENQGEEDKAIACWEVVFDDSF